MLLPSRIRAQPLGLLLFLFCVCLFPMALSILPPCGNRFFVIVDSYFLFLRVGLVFPNLF